MVVEGEEAGLVQVASVESPRPTEDGGRYLGQVALQLGVGELVAQAEGPFIRDELVERRREGAFLVTQVLPNRRGCEAGQKWRLKGAHGAADFRVPPLGLEREIGARLK